MTVNNQSVIIRVIYDISTQEKVIIPDLSINIEDLHKKKVIIPVHSVINKGKRKVQGVPQSQIARENIAIPMSVIKEVLHRKR